MGNKNCINYNDLSDEDKNILFENMKSCYTKVDETDMLFKYIQKKGSEPKIFIEPYTNKTKYIFENKLEFITFMKKFNRRFIIMQHSMEHGVINFVI